MTAPQSFIQFIPIMTSNTNLGITIKFTQNFLPQRVASNLDLALNALGTLIGVALAWLIHRRGGVERWQTARDRWFIGRSAGGLALAWVLIAVINKQSFGWTIRMTVPVEVLVQAVVLAIGAAWMAGYLPARWAARQPVGESLREE